MWRDEARRGQAGQAFELHEPGVTDRATANSLDADRRGPPQDDPVRPGQGPAIQWLLALVLIRYSRRPPPGDRNPPGGGAAVSGGLLDQYRPGNRPLGNPSVRSLTAGVPEEVCCHAFRATNITACLENGGTIVHAQQEDPVGSSTPFR
jgi:hypothetical protein